MKILLLGKNGQLGWELQRSLSPLGELHALGSAEVDLASADGLVQLQARLQALRPQLIVNAAAHTAVDRAESEPERCRAINATAPALLAEAARQSGALLVHYSTDYVFDGSGERPWCENDPTGPLNVYGQSKREGELALLASGCLALIFRTSWVYGARGGNFAKTMLRLAQERDQLTVINDQHGAPTGADLLADVSAHAIRATLAQPALAGLYHLVASGQTSWHGYAQFALRQAAQAGLALKADADAVRPVPTSAFPTAAQRPLNSRLNCQKLQAAFGLRLPPWQHGVERLLSETLDHKP